MALRGSEKIKRIPGSSFFAGRRGIIIAVIVAAVIVLLIFSALTRTYNAYQVRVTEKQENTIEYTYYTSGTNVIKCSTTQATLTDRKNNSLWRINYDMGNPAVAGRGDVFAIYDRQGSTVKICNESGELGSYNTDMPIVRADVAAQGIAAVLQDDGVYAVIDYYDTDGSRIGTIRTTMSQDGYPMDIALSSDGILLAVSFLNFNEGYPQTTIKFYNFGKQGQYRENNVAAQYTMENTLIPQLEYLDNNTCIAFCADKIQVYSGTGTPALRNEIPIEGEIAATFFDEKHFGIIERPADGNEYDRIRVFNKGGSQTSSRGESSSERTARIVHSLRREFKLKDILAVVGFPKATYMYWQKRFDREDPDAELFQKIKEIREEHKDYGYRRLWGELRKQGIEINKKRVHRIVRKYGMQVISYIRKSRRFSTYKGVVGRIAPNRVNRRFNTCIPHQKITTDTSEFKYYEPDEKGRITIKKLYLDPFLDLWNLEVLSYGISDKPSANSIMTALKEAIDATSDCKYRRTFHSDRGWAYQMNAYRYELEKNRIFQSMSRKSNCYDNSPMENFFGIMKQEMYYGQVYNSFDELKEAIDKYIRYYNEKRSKASLGYRSPIEYREYMTAA